MLTLVASMLLLASPPPRAPGQAQPAVRLSLRHQGEVVGLDQDLALRVGLGGDWGVGGIGGGRGCRVGGGRLCVAAFYWRCAVVRLAPPCRERQVRRNPGWRRAPVCRRSSSPTPQEPQVRRTLPSDSALPPA
jgi:hypothetical protein